MSAKVDIPILIAGAGPAGLTLALALAQNGIEARIIDKEPFYRPGQRGAGIQPRTLEIFNYLGLFDDIRAKAVTPPPERRIYKLPGGVEPLKTVPMFENDVPTPSTPIANALHLGQENTEAIMRAHLEKYGRAVELGTELRTLEQYPDHVVAHLVKKDGDVEHNETVTCHYVVGTDGGKGVTRKQLGLTFLGETREEHIVVGEAEVFGLERNYWHQWGDMSTTLCMMRPTENPNSFYIALGGAIDYAKIVADKDEYIKAVRAATDRHDLQIGHLRWVTDWRPNIRMVNKFREGRGFVAGDAAHVHSPTGGQGLNSSVQDTFNLAWKLTLVEKGWASPALLDTYNEERRPVITAMLQQSTALLNALEKSKAAGDAADDRAWRRERVLKMLGVNYRWSPIVVDERAPEKPKEPENVYGGDTGGDLRAGDRALDAPALAPVAGDKKAPISLFEIFKPVHHTVLLFTTETGYVTPIIEELKRYPVGSVKTMVVYPRGTVDAAPVAGADFTVVDTEGHAFAAYGISPERPTTAVVRPDGVVGAIAYGLDALRTYLKTVFSAI